MSIFRYKRRQYDRIDQKTTVKGVIPRLQPSSCESMWMNASKLRQKI